MKVIVAGSRGLLKCDGKIRLRLHEIFKQLSIEPEEIVCGMAVGPDKIGRSYALVSGIPVKEMPANWTDHGKAAGPIRNREMAEYADMAIVFWDGRSAGSLNMIKNMSKLNKICIVEVMENNDE